MLGNSATLDLVVETAGLTDLTCAQMRRLFDGIRIAVYENVSEIGFAQVPGIVGALDFFCAPPILHTASGSRT